MLELADRFCTILNEQGLKNKEFAETLGVTPNYISTLVKGHKPTVSIILSKLIEEKFGYASEWVRNGTGEKYLYKDFSFIQIQLIKKIRRMNLAELNAVTAFINTYEQINNEASEHTKTID